MFVAALKVWAHKIRNRNVMALCDNEVSVEVVNTGKARNRFAQACLREICFITARNNAVIKLVHISSETNRISDCLSRWGGSRQESIVPQIYTRVGCKVCTASAQCI